MGPAQTEAHTALKTEAHSFQEYCSTSLSGCPAVLVLFHHHAHVSDVHPCTCSLALEHTQSHSHVLLTLQHQVQAGSCLDSNSTFLSLFYSNMGSSDLVLEQPPQDPGKPTLMILTKLPRAQERNTILAKVHYGDIIFQWRKNEDPMSGTDSHLCH